MPLPAALVQAIADRPDGRVVLILGAGCSKEPPTGLLLAGELASRTHERLLRDRILDECCEAPEDLSAVADAVEAAAQSQSEMVQRMGPHELRLASPNSGHLLAAALLRERAFSTLLTLNFDLALSQALSQLGGGKDVAVVSGPTDYGDLGMLSLVYLHRNAHAEPQQWILRSDQLEHDWRGSWRQIVASRVMAAPVVVFAGLGTPAAVLVHTAKKLKEAAVNSRFQVDVVAREESAFAEALDISDEEYVQSGWCDFMSELGQVLAVEHRRVLEEAVEDMAQAEGLDDAVVAEARRCAGELENLGLIKAGRFRAKWFLEHSGYLPWIAIRAPWMALVVLALATLRHNWGAEIRFAEGGEVEVWRGVELLFTVLIVHGRAEVTEEGLDARLPEAVPVTPRDPPVVLYGGIEGGAGSFTPPPDIGSDQPPNDIVQPESTLQRVSLLDFIRSPDRLPLPVNPEDAGR